MIDIYWYDCLRLIGGGNGSLRIDEIMGGEVMGK